MITQINKTRSCDYIYLNFSCIKFKEQTDFKFAYEQIKYFTNDTIFHQVVCHILCM